MPRVSYAQTALSWARIETLRNRVQLVPAGRRPRVARIEDTMNVGDALRTASSSRAELRFNDGSLARIGQRATFRFTPNTRNFQLSNGTMLLLIPPGRGRTTIQTPNAVTGIQGSALFVRTISETDTTIVGALTNNPEGPMMAYNEDGSQQQPLYAGQMVVIEDDRISQILEFDLMTFYQTSGLVEGLNLDSPNETLGTDELDEVRQEILDAIDGQEPVEGPDTTDNPAFTRAPVSASGTTDTTLTVAFPEYEGSPAQGYYLQAGAESSTVNNAAALSTTTPTASINNTDEASQTSSPLDGFDAQPSTSQPSGGQPTPNATAPPSGGSSRPSQTPAANNPGQGNPGAPQNPNQNVGNEPPVSNVPSSTPGGGSSRPNQTPAANNPGQGNPGGPQQPTPAQETPRTPVSAGEFIWPDGAPSEAQSAPANVTTTPSEIAPNADISNAETAVSETIVPEAPVPETIDLETPESPPEPAIQEVTSDMATDNPDLESNLAEDMSQPNSDLANP